jgi:hypothetical protein
VSSLLQEMRLLIHCLVIVRCCSESFPMLLLLLLLLLLMMMMIIYGAHARQVSCVIWGFVALDCPLLAQVAKNSLWNDMLP